MIQPPSPPTDFRPDSSEFQRYHRDFTAWVLAKEEERLCQIPLILIDNREEWPQTLQSGPKARRKIKKPAWGLHDREYMREAKRAQRARDVKAPRPCMEPECLEPREGKKARCHAHNLEAQEREQVRNHKRKR